MEEPILSFYTQIEQHAKAYIHDGVLPELPENKEQLAQLLHAIVQEDRKCHKDSQVLLQEFFYEKEIPMLVLNNDVIQKANQQACRLYQAESEDGIIGKSLSELRTFQEEQNNSSKSNKLTVQTQHRTSQGDIIPVEECLLPIYQEEEGDTNLLIIHDLSQQEQADKARLLDQLRLRKIAEYYPNGGAIILSDTWEILFAEGNSNSAMPFNKLALAVIELLDKAAREQIFTAFREQKRGQCRQEILDSVYEIHIIPYSIENPSLTEVLLVLRDITTYVVQERNLISVNSALGSTIENLHIYQEELRAQNEELSQTQSVLEELRRRYEILFDEAPVYFFVLNLNGEIIQSNSAFQSVFTTDRHQERANLFTRFIPQQNDKTYFRDKLHQCIFNGVEAEFQMQCAVSNNREIWAMFSMKKIHYLSDEQQDTVLCTAIDITRQKTAEEILMLRTAALEKTRNELLQQTRFLQTISDTVPLGLFILEPETGRCLWVNHYISLTLGYAAEEWVKFIPSSVAAEALQQYQGAYSEGNILQPVRREYFIAKEDGKKLWLEGLWIPFRGRTGEQYLQVLGIAVDITARKKLEQQLLHLNEGLEKKVLERTQALEASNALMRSVMNSSEKVEIFSIDTHFRYTSFNDVHRELSFASGGALPKAGMMLENNPSNIPNEVRVGLLTALGGKSTVLNTRRVLDKKTYEYEAVCSPVVNEKSEVLGATVFTIDITERRINEERLRRSEMQLNEAQRIAHLGSWVFYPDSGTFVWSDEMFRFAGLEPQIFTPTLSTYLEVVHPEDATALKEELLAITSPMDSFETEIRYKLSNSSQIRIMLVKGRYALETETMRPSVAGTMLDITELKRLEQELRSMNENLEERIWDNTRELQRMNEELRRNADQKSLLLREVHHRLKNNLATVVTVIQVQKRIARSNPIVITMLADIESRIKAILHVHQHLHRTDGLDIIDVKPYLTMLINDVSSGFKSPNIAIISTIEEAIMNVETAQPCGLIVNELLTNAYKYAFPNGRQGLITVEFKEIPPEQVPDDAIEETVLGVKDKTNLRFWRISVTDNGVGLPVGFTLESGNSVGGFIIRSLISQLGAKLTFSSNEEGTMFNFIFTELRYNNSL